MVGVTRFERATFWSQTRRSSQTELYPELNGFLIYIIFPI